MGELPGVMVLHLDIHHQADELLMKAFPGKPCELALNAMVMSHNNAQGALIHDVKPKLLIYHLCVDGQVGEETHQVGVCPQLCKIKYCVISIQSPRDGEG